MANIFIYLLLGFLALAVGGFLLYLFMLKRARKNAYISYGETLGLSTEYSRKTEYKLEGNFRGYPVKIIPYLLETPGPQEWVTMQIPMINPNKMFLRITKGMEGTQWLEPFNQDETITVQHVMGPKVEILASDLFFSSLLLTDEMKARIDEVFRLVDKGTVYIKDNTLAAILPEGISKPDGWDKYKEVLALLVDIKDELAK